MSEQSSYYEELVGTIFIMALVSFILAVYISFSDAQLYWMLDYNANLVEDLGVFSRILATVIGTLGGVFCGSVAMFFRKIIVAFNSSHSSVGWFFVIVGVLGGCAVSYQKTLHFIVY